MKKKKWIRFRHRVIRNIAYWVFYPIARLKFGVTIEKFKEQEKRPYIILLNHQTTFDQFFVGIAFKGPIYYLATEDIFSNGWISALLRYAIAPIPIKKQTTDMRAVRNCIQVVKEGGTIAIAPEGNRTYSGKTEYMNPAIAPLVRKLKLPLALFRIEGGYGVQPRWSDCIRKGKMRAFVSKVIQPEDYEEMSNEQLLDLIQEELFVNEARADAAFLHTKQAEYLERAIYVCPYCGLAEWESSKDLFRCKKCGAAVRHLPTKELEGLDRPFPFRFVNDWYEYQKNYVNQIDTLQHTKEPLFEDTASLFKVILNKRKELLCKDASIRLFGDRLEINGKAFPFEQVTAVTVLGRNKLNIYHEDQVYQLKGGKRFNALKYVNFCYRHKNIIKGETNGEFLGL
ncbi:MAG: 1-acyl-sn-glycerol-3-phosphate acyltransferase [Clostridia bacterium]|nr:1-acyl-sn-glycerol-3-phosphate acyltransferase [Clostridia bacterium]